MTRTSIICGISIGLFVAPLTNCSSEGNPGERTNGFGGGSAAGSGSGGTAASANGGSGAATSAGSGGGGPIFVQGGSGGGATTTDAGFQDPDAACAAQQQDSKPIPTDIFIMLDKSISMNCAATDTACTQANTAVLPTRWSAVTDGIKAFATTPTNAGIGIGLSFFASNNMCDPQSYVTSATPIAPLPTGGTAVLNRITGTAPGGITPTVPALQGAILYAQKYMTENPGRSAAVVFVTDGMPNGCSSTVQTAADAAKAGFDATPKVETYVLGLGAVDALDQIALAGSGDATHFVDANSDPATALRDLLKMVAHPLTCDYPIPKSSAALNLDAVDVQTRVNATAPTVNLKYVKSAAECSAQQAWYYDVPPPGTPTKITLCPTACDALKGSDTASLQVVIGCVARVY
jgi:hypothetical protein